MKNRVNLLERILRELKIETIQYKNGCDMEKVRKLEEEAGRYDKFARQKLKRDYLDLDALKQAIADATNLALNETEFLFSGELNYAIYRIKGLTNAVIKASLTDTNKKLKSDSRYKVKDFGKVVRECALENSRFVQVNLDDVNIDYSNGIHAGCKANQLIYFRDLRALYKDLEKGLVEVRPSLAVKFDFDKI